MERETEFWVIHKGAAKVALGLTGATCFVLGTLFVLLVMTR